MYPAAATRPSTVETKDTCLAGAAPVMIGLVGAAVVAEGVVVVVAISCRNTATLACYLLLEIIWPTHPVNRVHNAILDGGISSKDTCPANKDIRALDRHCHGGTSKGAVFGAVGESGCVCGRSKENVLPEDVGKFLIREVGENGIIRGKEGDAGAVVEVGNQAGVLQSC